MNAASHSLHKVVCVYVVGLIVGGGHFHLHVYAHFDPTRRIRWAQFGICLIKLVIMNRDYCHFKFQMWSPNGEVIRV